MLGKELGSIPFKEHLYRLSAVVRTFMRCTDDHCCYLRLSTIDIQMLSLFTDYSSVGIYGIAFFMGSVIDGIKRLINQIAPQFAKA